MENDPVTDEILENWFTYHGPDSKQQEAYAKIRGNGYILAKTIRDNCPPSADRTVAIRHIRDAVMSANASIACGGK